MCSAVRALAEASCGDGLVAPPKLTEALVDDVNDDAVLLPHVGLVFLDCRADGMYQITHSATLEKILLKPDRKYELLFDDDGFGCLLAEDAPDDDPLFIEDMLSFVVYETPSGHRTIQSQKGPTAGQSADLS